MTKSANKKTKVRAFKSKSDKDSQRAQKLKDLQALIDQGLYKTSSMDIAKAYLHKAGHEFNTFTNDEDVAENFANDKKTLKAIK